MSHVLPDLHPARWIWYPSERCLPNTFVFFRRTFTLPSKPKRATGWVLGDSRYRFHANGQRVQWGPAPSDPRWPEVDPLDLTPFLQEGPNAIGCEVLYYGHGDGTSPLGKPGFMFRLEIEGEDGETQTIVSDATWQAMLARCWRAGHYPRWYLRALQEEFDARLYPDGWTTAEYESGADWLAALEQTCPTDKPSLCSDYPHYFMDAQGDLDTCALRARSIPLLTEKRMPVQQLTESMWVDWQRPPEEYFECLPPDAYRIDRTLSVSEPESGCWEVELDETRGAALTFELAEQAVGWPGFTIDAPAGTTIEMMVHEAHEPGGPPLLNTHYHSWTRFVCKEGLNRFETFDYESFRWMQLHLHGARGNVKIRDVGLRRRQYPWPNEPQVSCSDVELQRLLDASVNTLHNSAQDIIVDGMARERQQYSGDCGHQNHAIYLAFGETRLTKRYLSSYSQGITTDGFFLDCWPAYDRLSRIMQRQLQLSKWGPILDHGVGLVFDCYHHYLYTGDLSALDEPFPRLLRFVEYLKSIQQPDGLLPVEDLGTPCVWIDHIAYPRTRHKQCVFNLYTAAMLEHALVPICQAFGDTANAAAARAFGRELQDGAVKRFWSPERGLFVANRPWRSEEGDDRLCDRSLATSILFDQCPNEETAAAVRALVDCPPEMGFSYPANAGWRLWALGKVGRADTILKDLRQRWATMDSVRLNNTLQEDWTAHPDTPGSQWSHCPLAPLYILYMSIAGIRPLAPGFAHWEMRPQFDDLERVDLTAQTVLGPIEVQASGSRGERRLKIGSPANSAGELVLPDSESVDLPLLDRPTVPGHRRYALPAGGETEVVLKRI